MRSLIFTPLREDDLPLLHRWLNQPHMREFYQKIPVSFAETTVKFMPRIRGEIVVHDHLVLHAGRPFGKLQCYRNQDHPEYAREIGLSEGVSIDLFIGEPTMLGQGFGRAMLRDYVLDVAFRLHPDESSCFICHDIANMRARSCSVSAGFQPLRRVVEGGAPSEILMFRKSNQPPVRFEAGSEKPFC